MIIFSCVLMHLKNIYALALQKAKVLNYLSAFIRNHVADTIYLKVTYSSILITEKVHTKHFSLWTVECPCSH